MKDCLKKVNLVTLSKAAVKGETAQKKSNLFPRLERGYKLNVQLDEKQKTLKGWKITGL